MRDLDLAPAKNNALTVKNGGLLLDEDKRTIVSTIKHKLEI